MAIADFIKNIIPGKKSPEKVRPKNGEGMPKIGTNEVRKATETLKEYKAGKTNLEQRIIANEQWWKLRHWEQMRSNSTDPECVSAWLHNSVSNKHADAMDNFPEPSILPREAGDEEEAKKLSSIIPVVLEQNDFEQTYSDAWLYKLRGGAAVYGVFWDPKKLRGLGDISIKKCDILNLFWEPGISDIQDSQNLFHVQLVDNKKLKAMYSDLKLDLGSSTIDKAEYIYDDTVRTDNKSAVVDWYYKVYDGSKDILHYCKYVNDTVLFATENDPRYANGLYDHGRYPFEFDVLFAEEGTPAGFGLIDIMKSPQEYIDKLNQVILKNAILSAKPRYFVREDSAVNENEFLDSDCDLVHVAGTLNSDNLIAIKVPDMPGYCINVLNSKIDELKETSGNRDVSTGGTQGGATAASAIAALQEASGKTSRDSIKSSYRTFQRIVTLVIELIRQFYDEPRCFRITGQMGRQEFIEYSNAGIKEQVIGADFGGEKQYRLPVFDIKVVSQKSSPYSRIAQNEMAKEFYAAGFFRPDMTDQALACLEMMQFDGKDKIMSRIAENGTLYQQVQMLQQQMLQLATIVDKTQGTTIAQGLAAAVLGQGGVAAPGAINATSAQVNPLGDVDDSETSSQADKARQRAASVASPG